MILPPERIQEVEPSTTREDDREASLEVIEIGERTAAVETEPNQEVKASGRRKTTTSMTKKMFGTFKGHEERHQGERRCFYFCYYCAKTNSRQEGCSNRVDTSSAPLAANKPKVVSPSSSKGKGKKVTELDTAEFLKLNFSKEKGKLDHTKLEQFQGTFAKRDIKPGKVIKIKDLEDVFKHYEAVKNIWVFNFLKLSAPFYPTLIKIFYSNAEQKVRIIDDLTKEHWIKSCVMGKKIKLTKDDVDF